MKQHIKIVNFFCLLVSMSLLSVISNCEPKATKTEVEKFAEITIPEEAYDIYYKLSMSRNICAYVRFSIRNERLDRFLVKSRYYDLQEGGTFYAPNPPYVSGIFWWKAHKAKTFKIQNIFTKTYKTITVDTSDAKKSIVYINVCT